MKKIIILIGVVLNSLCVFSQNSLNSFSDMGLCVDYYDTDIALNVVYPGMQEEYVLNGNDPTNYVFTYYHSSQQVIMVHSIGTVNVTIENLSTGEVVYDSFEVIPQSPAFIIGVSVYNQTAEISVAGYGDYWFQIDDGEIQDNGGVFQNVPLGSHLIYVYHIWNGQVDTLQTCNTVVIGGIEVTTPNPPEGEATQSFVDGATLADIVVEGQNILWYSSETTSSEADSETSLPINTVLVDGATYYASQTIDGVESTDRLAVMIEVVPLSVNEISQQNLITFYPNPVSDKLYIESSETIKSISIINTLGQSMYEGFSDNINVSVLPKGVYFLKIKLQTIEVTHKFIKK